MAFALTKAPTADEMISEKGYLASFWRNVFNKAKERQASDIHVESLKSGLQIRFRINGVLCLPFGTIADRGEAVQLVDKLKEIANLDTSTKRVLQDTSFNLDLTDSTYRVSLSPGFLYGECAVLRIINNDDPPHLEKIEFTAQAKEDLKWAIQQRQGLFLVTGPTGSGKSTTLQACIAAIDFQGRKIISIENPPERILPGVVHEQITKDYTWTDAIKGAMREDPNVILVGEVRDRESAKLAVEAAQTGHLVLTTLHTNNVAATVNRLITLGIEKHLIADSLLFISAQRLLKKLCPCKKAAGDFFERSKNGCPSCQFTGFSGRIPILEYCLQPDPSLIYQFDHKAFEKILRQTLDSETRRLVALGLVDHRVLLSAAPGATS